MGSKVESRPRDLPVDSSGTGRSADAAPLDQAHHDVIGRPRTISRPVRHSPAGEIQYIRDRKYQMNDACVIVRSAEGYSVDRRPGRNEDTGLMALAASRPTKYH